jgi:hypothetical protein
LIERPFHTCEPRIDLNAGDYAQMMGSARRERLRLPAVLLRPDVCGWTKVDPAVEMLLTRRSRVGSHILPEAQDDVMIRAEPTR